MIISHRDKGFWNCFYYLYLYSPLVISSVLILFFFLFCLISLIFSLSIPSLPVTQGKVHHRASEPPVYSLAWLAPWEISHLPKCEALSRETRGGTRRGRIFPKRTKKLTCFYYPMNVLCHINYSWYAKSKGHFFTNGVMFTTFSVTSSCKYIMYFPICSLFSLQAYSGNMNNVINVS